MEIYLLYNLCSVISVRALVGCSPVQDPLKTASNLVERLNTSNIDLRPIMKISINLQLVKEGVLSLIPEEVVRGCYAK